MEGIKQPHKTSLSSYQPPVMENIKGQMGTEGALERKKEKKESAQRKRSERRRKGEL